MKSIYPIALVSLMTPVIFAQSNNAQPGSHAQPRASAGAATSDYVLTGKVTEVLTGRGVPVATVEAVDSHKIHYKTLSNPDGTYRLDHLPREQSLAIHCSQFGYNPNPQGYKANFKDGMDTWNPLLVHDDSDAAYLQRTAESLAALPPDQRAFDAMFISVNLPPASRSVVAAELKKKLEVSGGDNSLRDTLALFTPGPASDEQIRKAILNALNQGDLQDSYQIKFKTPIRVDVLDGHVVLAGVVNSQKDKDMVYKSAANVPSLVDVENKVHVSNGQSKAQPDSAHQF